MTERQTLSRVRAVFFDMDGTIYHGSRLFPTTIPFLEFLQKRGIARKFCSNNSSYSKKEYVARLARFGIESTVEDFYLSTDFLVDELHAGHPEIKRLFLLGMPAMAQELKNAGFVISDDDPDAVVVSFDRTLVYERLCRACWFLKQGLPGYATHPDPFCPTDQPTCLVDCGALAACVECASGKKLTMLGKPNGGFLCGASARLGLRTENTLMIGDRLATDIAAGVNAGTLTCRITGPGADLSSIAPVTPDWSFRDLGELQRFWEAE